MNKTGLILFSSVVWLLMFSGCASINLANYQFAEEEVVFESDFAEMPESAGGWEDNDQVIYDKEKELVHLRAKEGEGTGFGINKPVTRSSRVSFRIRLGEEVNSRHPKSHINLLVSHGNGYERIYLMFDDEGIYYSWDGDGSHGGGTISSASGLDEKQWYRVDILLNGSSGILFLDGKRKGTFAVSSKLPGWGSLEFECHNEYWVDDVRITHFDSYEVEKPE